MKFKINVKNSSDNILIYFIYIFYEVIKNLGKNQIKNYMKFKIN